MRFQQKLGNQRIYNMQNKALKQNIKGLLWTNFDKKKNIIPAVKPDLKRPKAYDKI